MNVNELFFTFVLMSEILSHLEMFKKGGKKRERLEVAVSLRNFFYPMVSSCDAEHCTEFCRFQTMR